MINQHQAEQQRQQVIWSMKTTDNEEVISMTSAPLLSGFVGLILWLVTLAVILTPEFILNSVTIAPGHPYVWLTFYVFACIPCAALASIFGWVAWEMTYMSFTGKDV